MSKHKALELADWLDNCEPNFYGESSSRMDDKLASAVADLTDTVRAQHAMIVQMREALETGLLRDEQSCECPDRMVHERGEHMSGCHLFDVSIALAAADQYLGEQK